MKRNLFMIVMLSLFFSLIFSGYAQGASSSLITPTLNSHEAFRSLRQRLHKEGIRLVDPVISEHGDVLVYNFPTGSSEVVGVAALIEKNSGTLIDLIVTRQLPNGIEVTGWISGINRTYDTVSEDGLNIEHGEVTIMFDPITWLFIGKVLWGATQAVALYAVADYSVTYGVWATISWVFVYAALDTYGNPTGQEWHDWYIEHVLLYTYTVNSDGSINYP